MHGTPILDPDNDEEDYNSNYVPSEQANASNDDGSDDNLLATGVDDGANPDGDKEAKHHDNEGDDNKPGRQ